MTAYADRDRLKLLALFLNRVEPKNIMNKENIPSYFSAACVILLVFIAFRNEQHSGKNPDLAARLDKLEAMINKIATSSNEQASLLHRAIGEVIPITIPTGIADKLNALQEKLMQKDSWPHNMDEMNALDAELQSILAEVSPWMEEELLPELNSIRWFLGAHELRLKEENLKFDEWLDYIDQLDTQISFYQNYGSPEVFSVLEKLRNTYLADYESLRKELVEAEARKVLEDENATLERQYEIFDQLSEWEDFESLAQMIRKRALIIETEDLVSSIRRELEFMTVEKEETFQSLNMGELGDSLGIIIDRRNQLLQIGVQRDHEVQETLRVLAGGIEKSIQVFAASEMKKNEKKIRSYQKEALDKIFAFNQQLTKAKIPRKIAVPLSDKTISAGNIPDYAKVANLMVTHLLPIDSRMLEPAVSRLYNNAFNNGWKILEDNKNLQTEVAKKEAVVEKMKL